MDNMQRKEGIRYEKTEFPSPSPEWESRKKLLLINYFSIINYLLPIKKAPPHDECSVKYADSPFYTSAGFQIHLR